MNVTLRLSEPSTILMNHGYDNESATEFESTHLPAYLLALPIYKDAASPLLGEHREIRRSQIAHSLIHKQNGEEVQMIPAATSRHVGSIIRASFIANIVRVISSLA